MTTAATICKWLGNIWLAGIVLLILLSYGMIWYSQGWGKLQEIANPFNLWNTAAIIVAVLPGIALLKLSDYFKRRGEDSHGAG